MYRHRGYQAFADHTFMFGQDAQRDVLMRLDRPQGSSVHVHVGAERDRFVGWTCSDPDGHSHDVANCSIADIEVTLKRPKQSELTLRASGTAAYELGMREQNHGISIQPFPDGPAPVPKP